VGFIRFFKWAFQKKPGWVYLGRFFFTTTLPLGHKCSQAYPWCYCGPENLRVNF